MDWFACRFVGVPPDFFPVTIVGLLPVMLGTGTGTRIMKRIAAPMVGGMVSSTVRTLVIIPAVYLLWKRFAMRETLSPMG